MKSFLKFLLLFGLIVFFANQVGTRRDIDHHFCRVCGEHRETWSTSGLISDGRKIEQTVPDCLGDLPHEWITTSERTEYGWPIVWRSKAEGYNYEYLHALHDGRLAGWLREGPVLLESDRLRVINALKDAWIDDLDQLLLIEWQENPDQLVKWANGVLERMEKYEKAHIEEQE